MNFEIVKIKDKNTTKQITKRYIFGLNIFNVNEVDCSLFGSPQLTFLNNICYQYETSAITGNLFDFADSPEELFGSARYGGGYKIVKFGYYGGEIYDVKEWKSFPPLLFPRISSEFINLKDLSGNSLILNIMYSDALCLLILPKHKNSFSKLAELLTSERIQTEKFINQATGLYSLVIFTQADGDYFTVYSQTTSSFERLNLSLKNSIELVEKSPWFKNNCQHLIWDNEDNMCLVTTK